eukprot:2626030-Rhodomonas_salina.1
MAINEIADINNHKEFPELEQSGRMDLMPDARQIWRFVDENPYFESSDDCSCFKAAFCTHETAPQAAVEMARQAYLRSQ